MKKEKHILLKLTLKEAIILAGTLGGQTSDVGERCFKNSLYTKEKYDDDLIYNIFDRLDNQLVKMGKKK